MKQMQKSVVHNVRVAGFADHMRWRVFIPSCVAESKTGNSRSGVSARKAATPASKRNSDSR